MSSFLTSFEGTKCRNWSFSVEGQICVAAQIADDVRAEKPNF
jgi:hypothetical protein